MNAWGMTLQRLVMRDCVAFLLSRVCSQNCQMRKQTREGVLGFVSIFGVLVNKHGNRITLTRARLPRLFTEKSMAERLKEILCFWVCASVHNLVWRSIFCNNAVSQQNHSIGSFVRKMHLVSSH